ncbi:MAG: DUF2637 domain-containing protein, partial [Trebonia sp.]
MRRGDAGPHPNKAHAAWGRRAHRLEPDLETAHMLRWIFAQRLAGHSVAMIARALNEAGVPCPSAADPGRNPYRTGTGWTLGTVAAADRVIRCTTAGAVLGVAVVASVASYEHAHALVQAHGEAGWTGRLVPLTVDGLIYASSMVMLDSARRKTAVPGLARWLLGLGIAATLAANVAHGLG